MSSIKNLNKGVVIANEITITPHKAHIVTLREDEGQSIIYIYEKTGISGCMQCRIMK